MEGDAERDFEHVGKVHTMNPDHTTREVVYDITRPLDGIIAHHSGVVRITASSAYNDRYGPEHIADLSTDTHFCSKNIPNSWIALEIPGLRVAPTSYSIRSYCMGPDGCHPRSFVLEASNDRVVWKLLDCRENVNDLNDRFVTRNFPVSDCVGESFRSIRLRQTGKNHWQDDHLAISAFDIFGTIYAISNEEPDGVEQCKRSRAEAKQEQKHQSETENREEEMKRRVEEAEKRIEEMKKREEEAREKHQLEMKNREDEMKKREDEMKKREVEMKRRVEEMKNREEEMKRREAEMKKREEEMKKREEEAKQREVEKKKREEEAKQGEVEAKQGEVEAKQGEVEAKQGEVEAKQGEVEAQISEAEAMSDESCDDTPYDDSQDFTKLPIKALKRKKKSYTTKKRVPHTCEEEEEDELELLKLFKINKDGSVKPRRKVYKNCKGSFQAKHKDRRYWGSCRAMIPKRAK